jgi:hypothetical protein
VTPWIAAPRRDDDGDTHGDALDTGGVSQSNTEGVTVESTTRRAAERRPDPRLERVQREHELSRAYAAAKTLEERLELAGLDDLAVSARRIRALVNERFVTDKASWIRLQDPEPEDDE